ncbi:MULTISPECIES: hypothetical protein [Rathayibacter]|nr:MULTISPECIES: hypothetical protein [Rathayibacter]
MSAEDARATRRLVASIVVGTHLLVAQSSFILADVLHRVRSRCTE